MGLSHRSTEKAEAQGMPAGHQATLGFQLKEQEDGFSIAEGLLRDERHGDGILKDHLPGGRSIGAHHHQVETG